MQLSEEGDKNYNQLVRWVTNKDDHANKIQKIVSQYFLHQRIKPVEPENEEAYKKYVKHLTLLHEISVYAMKAKQTTDLEYIKKLRMTVDKFEDAYFHTHE
jgi:nickel superoxide dismutase